MEENNPHPVEENPEELIGKKTLDPWDDPEQTDWPTNESETKVSEEVTSE